MRSDASRIEPEGTGRGEPRGTWLVVLSVTLALAWAPAPVWGSGYDDGAAAGDRYDVGDDPLFGDDPLSVDDPLFGDAPTADGDLDTTDPEDMDVDPLFDDDFDLELDDAPAAFPDPFERFNRGVLSFNNVVDRFVMDPITIVYRFLLPEPVRRSVERFFDNVNSTQTLVNDLFQLEWRDAGVTGARLLVNSTVGLGGLFDPAKRWGIEGHSSDFGQTLAIAGAPSGAYFMLPLLGPSNIRDGLGLGVDAIFHPTFFVLGGTDVLFFSGSSGITERARHYDELKALQESSIDYYAALRSGYYQNRQSEIWSRREDRRPGADGLMPVSTAAARPVDERP